MDPSKGLALILALLVVAPPALAVVQMPMPQLSFDFLKPVIDAVKYALSLDWLIGTASAADRYLVLGDPGCTPSAIATDTGCWSATTGGAGGASVPGPGDRAVADDLSGSGTATQDAAMSVASLLINGNDATIITWNTGGFSFSTSSSPALLCTYSLCIANGGRFEATSSTISTGSVTVSDDNAAFRSWIKMGSSTWTIVGTAAGAGLVNTWADGSTTGWDAGTSTVILQQSGAALTHMHMGGSPGAEFYNLEFHATTVGNPGLSRPFYDLTDNSIRVANDFSMTSVGCSYQVVQNSFPFDFQAKRMHFSMCSSSLVNAQFRVSGSTVPHSVGTGGFWLESIGTMRFQWGGPLLAPGRG